MLRANRQRTGDFMALRDAWIEKRTAANTGEPGTNGVSNNGANGATRNFSQMHYARQGLITEEMAYVALREKLTPEAVRRSADILRASAADAGRDPDRVRCYATVLCAPQVSEDLAAGRVCERPQLVHAVI